MARPQSFRAGWRLAVGGWRLAVGGWRLKFWRSLFLFFFFYYFFLLFLLFHRSGVSTLVGAAFSQDFIPSFNPGFPAKIGYGDGDGVVPIRSSLRSQVWQTATAAAGSGAGADGDSGSGGGDAGGGIGGAHAVAGSWVVAGGHALVHRVYPGMSHASCLLPDSPAARRCFNDVLAALLNQTLLAGNAMWTQKQG